MSEQLDKAIGYAPAECSPSCTDDWCHYTHRGWYFLKDRPERSYDTLEEAEAALSLARGESPSLSAGGE